MRTAMAPNCRTGWPKRWNGIPNPPKSSDFKPLWSVIKQIYIDLQNSKCCFCEKPLEISVERCQQLISAVKTAKRRLGVAYRCRFEPHHLEAIRLAHSREIGALRSIDAYFGFDIEPSVWRLKRALSGGGPLLDLGIYALQATRYLTGEEPTWVSGLTTGGDAARFSEVEAEETLSSSSSASLVGTASGLGSAATLCATGT